jgi:hypothetical protein
MPQIERNRAPNDFGIPQNLTGAGATNCAPLPMTGFANVRE